MLRPIVFGVGLKLFLPKTHVYVVDRQEETGCVVSFIFVELGSDRRVSQICGAKGCLEFPRKDSRIVHRFQQKLVRFALFRASFWLFPHNKI